MKEMTIDRGVKGLKMEKEEECREIEMQQSERQEENREGCIRSRTGNYYGPSSKKCELLLKMYLKFQDSDSRTLYHIQNSSKPRVFGDCTGHRSHSNEPGPDLKLRERERDREREINHFKSYQWVT